jgi:hypothetical protein
MKTFAVTPIKRCVRTRKRGKDLNNKYAEREREREKEKEKERKRERERNVLREKVLMRRIQYFLWKFCGSFRTRDECDGAAVCQVLSDGRKMSCGAASTASLTTDAGGIVSPSLSLSFFFLSIILSFSLFLSIIPSPSLPLSFPLSL